MVNNEEEIAEQHSSPEYDDHRPFHDQDWNTAFLLLPYGRDPWQRLADDLTLYWRGVNDTFRWPWLSVKLVCDQIDLTSQTTTESVRRILEVVALNSMSRLESILGHTFSDAQNHEFRKYLDSLSIRAKNVGTHHSKLECPQMMWKLARVERQFMIGVWSTVRLSYCGLFFGFEAFLDSCKKHAEKSIGLNEDIRKNKFVMKAKEVRNSVVHNGGRPNRELEKILQGKTPNLVISKEGRIQIMPNDVRGLYDGLRDLAFQVIETELA